MKTKTEEFKPFPPGTVRGPYKCGWRNSATGGVQFLVQTAGGWVPFIGAAHEEGDVCARAEKFAQEQLVHGSPATEEEMSRENAALKTLQERFHHDVCPRCQTASVPAEEVPEQSLRGCPKCGHVWAEDLTQPPTTITPAAAAVVPLKPELEDETVSLPVAQGSEIAKLRVALSECLSQLEGPAGVWGDGIGNDGKKTGPTHQEFNELRASRIARVRAILAGNSEPLRVVIEVAGGCAECTEQPFGVEVEIVDHDNAKAGI